MPGFAPTLVAIAAAAMLSACASTHSNTASTSANDAQIPSIMTCHVGSQDFARGRMATDEVLAELQKATGARSLRRLRSNQPATLEFNPERANVVVGDDDRILRVYCG